MVEVTGAERLSAARRRGVMKSLQLYLEGFVEPGERFARVGMNSYGLLLAAGDDAALSRRLAILEQDAGFLFMPPIRRRPGGARRFPSASRRSAPGRGAAVPPGPPRVRSSPIAQALTTQILHGTDESMKILLITTGGTIAAVPTPEGSRPTSAAAHCRTC